MTTPALPTPEPTAPAAPTAPAGEPPKPEPPKADPPAFEAITSQDAFERRLSDRLQRERAKYADYDDLKSRAAKLAEIEAENQTEAEKAAARAEAAETRARDLIARTVKAEAKALAADTFADPDDAHLYVDASTFADDDGRVDTDALRKALADVIERKPHLAKQGASHGDVGQGARPVDTPGGPAQLSRDDIKGMTPEAIEQARQEGRLNDALGIKT